MDQRKVLDACAATFELQSVSNQFLHISVDPMSQICVVLNSKCFETSAARGAGIRIPPRTAPRNSRTSLTFFNISGLVPSGRASDGLGIAPLPSLRERRVTAVDNAALRLGTV